MNLTTDDLTVFRGASERDWPHDAVVIFHDDSFAREAALRYCRRSEAAAGGPREVVHQSWTLNELADDSAGHLAWLEASHADRVILALSAGDLRPEWREALENWLAWAAGRVGSLLILGVTHPARPGTRLVAARAAEHGVACTLDTFLPPARPWSRRPVGWGINE